MRRLPFCLLQLLVVAAVMRASAAGALCPVQDSAADPNRPTFTFPATPTQCGMFEVDYGWTTQSWTADLAGEPTRQNYAPLSVRYGVTPRLDLRWGGTPHILQSGNPALQGAGDEYVGARYMFLKQSARVPAMALFYQLKVPVANPAKGLGTGLTDHLFTLLVSKDLGRYHVDFNLDETLAGAAGGHDGALQGDLALTRALTKKASVVVEAYGGSQPATKDRLGIVLLGATYAVRPWFVVDAGFDQTYTAGVPRQQILVGATTTLRPPWHQAPRHRM